MYKRNIILSVIGFVALSVSASAFSMGDYWQDRKYVPREMGEDLSRIFKRIFCKNMDKIRRFVEKYGNDPKMMNLTNKIDPRDVGCSYGNYIIMTPLLFALHPGIKNEQAALLLLSSNVIDVNKGCNHKRMPLHMACESKMPRVVVELLKKGANIFAKDENNRNTMHICWDRERKPTNIDLEDELRIAKLLIDNGGRMLINEKTNNGNTPFHLVCLRSDFKTIKYLVKNGAKIKDINPEGKTPLHLVLENKDISHEDKIKTIMLLVVMGAEIDDKAIQIVENCILEEDPEHHSVGGYSREDIDNKKLKMAEKCRLLSQILNFLNMIREYNNAENKVQFFLDKEVALEKSYDTIDEKFLSIYKEFQQQVKEKKFCFKFDFEDKFKFVIDSKKNNNAEDDLFEFLIKFVLYKSIRENIRNNNPDMLERETCRSFESTDFYRYYKESKNKKNIARILSVQDTGNAYEFIKDASKKNDFCFGDNFFVKNIVGSKMLENKKHSDCIIKNV